MQITRTVFRDDHEMLRTTARRFFERECVPKQAEWDKAGRVDRETWLKAGREGLLCVTLPTEYGGGGGDFGHAAVLAEEVHALGRQRPGPSACTRTSSRPTSLRIGTEEQKQQVAAEDLPRRDRSSRSP